jgi:hypothetical protein
MTPRSVRSASALSMSGVPLTGTGRPALGIARPQPE